MKKCPKCSEELQNSQKKCKYCGKDIQNWFRRHKIMSLILVLFIIGSISNAIKQDPAITTESKSDKIQEISKIEEIGKNGVRQEESTPKTDEEKIKEILLKTLKEENIKNIFLNAFEQEGLLYIEYKVASFITLNSFKKSTENIMAEIYKNMYEHILKGELSNITKIEIATYGSTKDKYGNENEKMAYMTALSATEAQKMNWQLSSSDLEFSVIPKVWELKFISPEFKNID